MPGKNNSEWQSDEKLFSEDSTWLRHHWWHILHHKNGAKDGAKDGAYLWVPEMYPEISYPKNECMMKKRLWLRTPNNGLESHVWNSKWLMKAVSCVFNWKRWWAHFPLHILHFKLTVTSWPRNRCSPLSQVFCVSCIFID